MAKINQIGNKTSALEINGAYSLPTADGTADKTFTTDGASAVTFEDEGSQCVQQVYSFSTSSLSPNSSIPDDNTIPQKTEGVEILTVTITPTSATNYLVIQFSGAVSSTALASTICALFQDDGDDALCVVYSQYDHSPNLSCTPLIYRMVAGTTSATTFKLRMGIVSGSINGNFGAIGGLNLSVIEYKN